MYFDCPKLCRKERSKRRNGWRANGLVWKGRASTFWCEFGHLYGGGSRAQTATFSLLQGRKEASHDVNSHQCLWWEEREREREGEGEMGVLSPGAREPGGRHCPLPHPHSHAVRGAPGVLLHLSVSSLLQPTLCVKRLKPPLDVPPHPLLRSEAASVAGS